jgi:hypothetical protein
MAAKTTSLDTALLSLLLNATPIASLADNAGTSPATTLYLSLHTASPGASGNQATNEAAYSAYARAAVTRNSSGFTVSGGRATLAGTATFPAATGGSETETYFGLGLSSTGAGTLLYFGPIAPSIAVSSGVTPKLTTGTAITES